MRRSYYPAWVTALSGFGIVAVQAAQIALFRDWWWGSPGLGSGFVLHATLWGSVASALVGAWLTRPSVVDGSAQSLRTAVRSPATIAAHSLIPFVAVIVAGQVSFGIVLTLLGRDWYGRVDWLLIAAAAFWLIAGALWGYRVGLKAPWKSAWFMAPGGVLLVMVIGTSLPQLGDFLPILPSSTPFVPVPLVRQVYLAVAALVLMLFLWMVVSDRRGNKVPFGAGLVALIFLPSVLPLGGFTEDQGAYREICDDGQTISVCLPAGYAPLEERFRTVMTEAAMAHPEIFEGIEVITAVPGEYGPETLYVLPTTSGDTSESMLATDQDLTYGLAEALAVPGQCFGNGLNALLSIRVAEMLGVADTYPRLAEATSELGMMEGGTIGELKKKFSEVSPGEVTRLVVGRRGSDTCSPTAEEFLALR